MPINSDGKVAYIYKDGTWYAISGAINTNASYTWTAAQTFSSPVTFQEVITAKAGINNFQSPEIRDTLVTTPVNGMVCFIRQETTGGTTINQLQYYDNGWKNISGYSNISSKLGSYTITADDAGKVITVDSSSSSIITVPTNTELPLSKGFKFDVVRIGTGSVMVDSSATILSKNPSGAFIDSQYGRITVVKIDTNTWIASGDIYEGVSSPTPTVPTPTVPTPTVPTPTVPTPTVPTPSVPTPSVPTPSVPTPSVPTPSVAPVPSVPTPSVPTPSVPTPTSCGDCETYTAIFPTCNGEDSYEGIFEGTRKTCSDGSYQVCVEAAPGTGTFIGFGNCLATNVSGCGGSGGSGGPCGGPPAPAPTPTQTGFYASFCSEGIPTSDGGPQYTTAGALESWIYANYTNVTNITYNEGSAPALPTCTTPTPTTPTPTVPTPSQNCDPEQAWSYNQSMCQYCGYEWNSTFGECFPPSTPTPTAPTPTVPTPSVPTPTVPTPTVPTPTVPTPTVSTARSSFCSDGACYTYVGGANCTQNQSFVLANYENVTNYNCVVGTTTPNCPTCTTPTPTPTAPTPTVPTPTVPTPSVPTPTVPTPSVPTPTAPTPTVPTPTVSTARSSFCSEGACYTYVGGSNCTQNQSFVLANYNNVTNFNCVVGTTTPNCPTCTTPTPTVPTPSVPTPSVPTPSVPTPSVPTPSVPTPTVPTPTVPTPTPTAPTPSVPTPSVPTPTVPTPTAPTPSVPTPTVPTPTAPTPSVPTPTVPTPTASCEGCIRDYCYDPCPSCCTQCGC